MAPIGSKASPCNKRLREIDMDRVLSSLPKVAKTGHEVDDNDAEAKRDMLGYIIKSCCENDSHILSLHRVLTKRQKAEQNRHADLSVMLDHISIVSRLPEERRITWLAEVSDLTTADIVAAKKSDSDADRQLYTFATGMGHTVKLPQEMKPLVVFTRFSDSRHRLFSERLAKFKAGGGWNNASKCLNWAAGCYKLAFKENGDLDSVTHCSGAKVTAPDWCKHVNREWSLQENWSDWTANIEKRPAPAIALRLLFEGSGNQASTGPHTLPLLKGGLSKELNQTATDLYLTYKAELDKLKITNSEGTETKEALSELRHERTKASSAKARAKALASISQRRPSAASACASREPHS